jgi:UDP-N-acetylglucosamine 2-epimerase
VIDVPCATSAIVEGIARALEPRFRDGLAGMANPYGDGQTAARVLEVLRSVELAPLKYKKFHDA